MSEDICQLCKKEIINDLETYNIDNNYYCIDCSQIIFQNKENNNPAILRLDKIHTFLRNINIMNLIIIFFSLTLFREKAIVSYIVPICIIISIVLIIIRKIVKTKIRYKYFEDS